MGDCGQDPPKEKTGDVAEGLVGEPGTLKLTAPVAFSAAALAVVLPLPPSPLLLCPDPPNPDLLPTITNQSLLYWHERQGISAYGQEGSSIMSGRAS